MAAGFSTLLQEAGMLAMQAISSNIPIPVSSSDASANHYVRPHMKVAYNRMLMLHPWTMKANAFLQPYGLFITISNWIEETRDDNGNKTGEFLCSALQVLEIGSPPHAISRARAAMQGPGAGVPANVIIGSGPTIGGVYVPGQYPYTAPEAGGKLPLESTTFIATYQAQSTYQEDPQPQKDDLLRK